MENASKALIMAGGILLAIALITFGVYTFNSLHNMSKTQDERMEQQQLAEFNKSYEAYNRKLIYGIDLISVINKAKDNNNQYNDTNYNINIYIEFKTNDSYEVTENDTFFLEKGQTGFEDFKRRIFKCTDVDYSDKTGRINKMNFEEVELTNYE